MQLTLQQSKIYLQYYFRQDVCVCRYECILLHVYVHIFLIFCIWNFPSKSVVQDAMVLLTLVQENRVFNTYMYVCMYAKLPTGWDGYTCNSKTCSTIAIAPNWPNVSRSSKEHLHFIILYYFSIYVHIFKYIVTYYWNQKIFKSLIVHL